MLNTDGELNLALPWRLSKSARREALHSSKKSASEADILAVRQDNVIGHEQRHANTLKMREFLWAHWLQRTPATLLLTSITKEGSKYRQVGVTIAPGGLANQVHAHIPNPEAHEAYLLAEYHWNKRTLAGWKTAEQYFQRAIEKDPEYADAYAGLAECSVRSHGALAYAKKAVELEPNSAETRTALGWVEVFQAWDFIGAAEALKTAIQLDPNYAPAHHTYSGVLQFSGRLKEAIAEAEQAVRLDPLVLIHSY